MIEGLKNWKKFLKKGGYLVFSDLVWLGAERPKKLADYFEKESPYILTIDQAIKEIAAKNYECLHHFTLAPEAWTENYYSHQKNVMKELRVKYEGNKQAQATFDDFDIEHEIFLNYHTYFGYEFFIVKNG